MYTFLKKIQRHQYYFRLLLLVLIIICSIPTLYLHYRTIEVAPIKEISSTATTSSFARSVPIRLQIPKIKLDTTFVPPLGLTADKTVEVPNNYTEVGWYSGGVSPGEIGTSVILGHVDSYIGPAIFYKLAKLEAGDEVVITREDGTIATFEVQSLERYARKDFPTQLVYEHTDNALLRLVTCSGTFNKGKQEYSHNLVVYATFKK